MVAGDRLADRIGIGVLTKVFPPELVDRVVDEAGVREQRKRTLPARVVVYYLLAMVLFFQSGYGEVWNKLVAGLDWARRFRARMALGMQPTPGGDHAGAPAAGLAGDGRAAGGDGRAAGRGGAGGGVRGRDAAGRGRRDVPGPARPRRRTGPSSATRATTPVAARSRRSASSASASAGPGRCWARELSPLATGEQPLARQLLARLRPRGPAAGRPELPVPRPARRRARRRGARAVAGEERRGPAGAGGAAGRHVPVADRRPGRLPADAPQGRGSRRTSPASRCGSSSTR